MPKENTHLFFARETAKKLEDQNIQNIIQKYEPQYLLGSVSPDSFFYGGSENIKIVSETIHGKDGGPTNEIVFELLERAKEQKDEGQLAFALGFLNHCILDIVFHPVIIYLTGKLFQSNEKKRTEAYFNHRLWETRFDRMIGNKMTMDKNINKPVLDKVEFYNLVSHKFKIEKNKLVSTARRQILLNRLFKVNLVYHFAQLLYNLKLVKKDILGLFYHPAETYQFEIPEKIKYRDLVSGEEQTVSWQNLLQKASWIARQRMAAAYEFYLGRIDKKTAQKVILGESLETGREGMKVDEIRYTFEKEINFG